MKRVSALFAKKSVASEETDSDALENEIENENVLLAMCEYVAKLCMQPEMIDEVLTQTGQGASKQAFADLCIKVWFACNDNKVAMHGATRSCLVELSKTSESAAETLRRNGFGSKVVGLYLLQNDEAVRWLQQVTSFNVFV